MMAKPAATKIRLRNKLQDRPPRPDPPLFRHLPPPAPPETRRRRSLRPRRRRQLSEDDFDGEDEEERGQKKIRLVVKLPLSPAVRPRRPPVVSSVSSSSSSSASPSPAPSSSSSYVDDDALGEKEDEDEEAAKPPRKRRIESCRDVPVLPLSRSGRPEVYSVKPLHHPFPSLLVPSTTRSSEESRLLSHHTVRKKNAVERLSGDASGNVPSSRSGTPLPERKELKCSRSGTPLPERKELELILHKLQKNDIYGAFAEPVDPEELPDYHDVIEHPMDFATVKKKMARGAYRFFEQFEDDVLLICSNAMQYNAPDTVYFRQACVIQDLARKKFQTIRDSMLRETDQLAEEKATLRSIEKETLLTRIAPKTRRKSAVEPLLSDLYSGATLTSSSDTFTRLSTVNGIEKSVAINGVLEATCSRQRSKQDKSVVANKFVDANSVGESKQDKAVTVNGIVDASSFLRESKQEKSVAVKRFLDSSSSPREKKLEKSVTINRIQDAGSSLGESRQEKFVAASRLQETSSSPRESKLEKAVAVNKVLDSCSSPTENKQERSAAVSGLLDGSTSLGESKQEKPVTVNGLDASSQAKQDKGDEFSVKSSPSKLGRKPVVVDENRRATYNIIYEQKPTVDSNFVLDIFEDEQKQLVPVELDAEHSYAKSLVQFAASLGPLAWEIASKKVEKSLPPGIKFGRGWVGEYVPLPAPFLSFEKQNPKTSTSFSRTTDTKDMISEMNPKTHRKAPNSGKSTSSGEQKPLHLRVCSTAQSKTIRTFGQKQCNDTGNTNHGVHNQMSHRKTYVAPIRVKEESPYEETITERRQQEIRSGDSTHTGTQNTSHQTTNQPAQFTNVLPHSSFSGIFSRGNNHMQTEQDSRRISSQNLNNTPPDNGTPMINSLPFISTHQTGVNYGLTRGYNLDKAPVTFPGKVGNQQNLPMPIVSALSKDNFSPVRAWMSVGTSGQWKPVEGKNTSEKSNMSSSSSSSPFSHNSWRPPSHFTGDPANLLLRTEAPQVKNRGLVIFPQLIPTDLSKYKTHHQNKKRDNLPPDLNIGYQPPTSPMQSSSLAMDSQHPDLALQL